MTTSQYFPHVDLTALMSWASRIVIGRQPSPRRPGAKRAKIQPKIKCEDIVWAGEKMILLTVERTSLPSGPHVMLAHFPQGRKGLTTQALVGMTATIRETCDVRAPEIYAYMDYLPNPVGAEVVLMEKTPGQCLQDIWPNLTTRQIQSVCIAVTEILVRLFNNRASLICTDLLGTDVNTRPVPPGQVPAPSKQPPILLTAPFDQGPLINMPPQPALRTTQEYLEALAGRIFRVFPVTPTGRPVYPQGHPSRKTGLALRPELSDEDVEALTWNWANWQRLTPYHTGGNYVPKHLSATAQRLAVSFLRCNQFAIRHPDMRMSRFIVSFQDERDWKGGVSSITTLTLTGWEHAHRAPLWSCARLPPWLDPGPEASDFLREEEKVVLRRVMVGIVNDRIILPTSWQFFVAHVFGATERWFEDCLSTHWLTENPLEVCLNRLSQRWESTGPGIEFPLARPKRTNEQAPESRDAVAESVSDSSGEADAAIQTQGID